MSLPISPILLSPHFALGEFLRLSKYPDNIPTLQAVANLTYGCLLLLEPARQLVEFLSHHALTDQLLTGPGWLHISWSPFGKPRHYVRLGYYK